MQTEEIEELQNRAIKLEKLAKELIFTMANLRFYSKYWNEHYGADNRNVMKRWETRADEMISQINEEGEYDLVEMKVKQRKSNAAVVVK